MIEKPTVLILGAGASMPVGHISGAQLMSEDIECRANGGPLGEFLQQSFGSSIDHFINDLRFSSLSSIDAFIAARPEHQKVGKASIAFAVSQREMPESLCARTSENWYLRLYQELVSEGFERFSDNQLKVITFNYDRSLEQFLFQSLKASYNKSNIEIAEKVNSIQVIHLYGSLGPLSWQVPINGINPLPVFF